MTDKECINRLKTSYFGGANGFDWAFVIETLGHLIKMYREGKLIIRSEENEI